MTSRARLVAVAVLTVVCAGAGVDAGADTLVTTSPNPAVPTPVRVNAQAVQKAMQDEIARSMKDLHMGDEPRPYYVAYTVSDVDQATASATLGAITASHAYRGRLTLRQPGGRRVMRAPVAARLATWRR